MKEEIRNIVNSLLRTQRAYIEAGIYSHTVTSTIRPKETTKEWWKLIFNEYKFLEDRKNKLFKEYELKYNKFIDILYEN